MSGGHEEGGFIVQNTIVLPSYENCRVHHQDIVATFHTHPNTGPDYLQEPSETDRQAVRDDPDLKGEKYLGEFVVSARTIFQISPNGQVSEAGKTEVLLQIVGGIPSEGGDFLGER